MSGNRNSRIEVLLGVIRNLLDDIATMIEEFDLLRVPHVLNVRREFSRDFRYISSRVDHEGLSFLTVSLPRLGKWYDSVLAETTDGVVLPGFKPWSNACSPYGVDSHVPTCPLFLRTYMYVLYDPGVTRQGKACIIQAFRSLLFLFYKMEVPFTEDQLSLALQNWKDNETELQELDFPSYYDSDLINARLLISHLMSPGEGLFRNIDPRHGPGAVAGGEDNEGKWESYSKISSLHRVYPRYDYYFGIRSDGRISSAMCGEIIKLHKSSSCEEEAVSRLLFVPKDSRGPRTISCEPKELMFLQQGVGRNLMTAFHSYSHGRINFVDQQINGDLALLSSDLGYYATVDLQDASDRVSCKLVELMFPGWAQKYLFALRSQSTMLPDGTLYKGHHKYAPMGSALCFPIESAVFWALAVVAGINSGYSVTDAMADTYVYGDDIVCPSSFFPHLVRVFSRLGLKVNTEKSYVSGPFRESCGCDAWNGVRITPFKIKKDISRRSLDGSLAAAICEYASTCFSLNYRKTGEYCMQIAESRYNGIIRSRIPLACLHVLDPLADDLERHPSYRWSKERCSGELVGWIVSNPRTTTRLDGLPRLLKNLYGNWEEHRPDQVATQRLAKTRKRRFFVEG